VISLFLPLSFYQWTKKNYYYLMCSFGSLSSAYNMRCARSETPEGPYTDVNGNPVVCSTDIGTGNKMLGSFRWENDPVDYFCPGHNDMFVTSAGVRLIAYHCRTNYFIEKKLSRSNNFHYLYLGQFDYNSDGWPVMNANRYAGEELQDVTDEELLAVENLVNEKILEDIKVECREMPIEEAKKLGAMALFGEKYGDVVRVVTVGEFSKEFCGGTHIDSTAKLGLFKLVSESSVAAGVRRIEAVTGLNVIKMIYATNTLLKDTAVAMKVNNPSDLPAKAAQVNADLKEKDREIESMRSKIASMNLGSILDNAVEVKGVKIVTAMLSGTGSDALRTMCDKIRDEKSDTAIVAVLAGVLDGKATLAATATKAAQAKGVKAGVLVKAVAQLTGGGAGAPGVAMGAAFFMAGPAQDAQFFNVEGFKTYFFHVFLLKARLPQCCRPVLPEGGSFRPELPFVNLPGYLPGPCIGCSPGRSCPKGGQHSAAGSRPGLPSR